MSLPTAAEIIREVLEIIKDTSWTNPAIWSPETVYVYGDIVRPSSGAHVAKVYVCQASGISGTTEPTWPASGTVADNGITWAYSSSLSAAITAAILALINRECHLIAGEVLLPPLETSSSVATVTDANYISMPANYHRNLYAVYNSDDEYWLQKRYIYRNYNDFITVYNDLDLSGDVFACCVKDGAWHYYFRPASATNFTLYYYKRVTDMDDLTDTPDCFPDHLLDGLVEDLLVSRVAKRLLKRIYRTDKQSDGMIAHYETEAALNLQKFKVNIKTETPVTRPRFAQFVVS